MTSDVQEGAATRPPPESCPRPDVHIIKDRRNSPTLRTECTNCSFGDSVVTLAAALSSVQSHMEGAPAPASPELQLRLQMGAAGIEDMGLWQEYSRGCAQAVGWRWWISPDYVAAARRAFGARIRAIIAERLREQHRQRTYRPGDLR